MLWLVMGIDCLHNLTLFCTLSGCFSSHFLLAQFTKESLYLYCFSIIDVSCLSFVSEPTQLCVGREDVVMRLGRKSRTVVVSN